MSVKSTPSERSGVGERTDEQDTAIEVQVLGKRPHARSMTTCREISRPDDQQSSLRYSEAGPAAWMEHAAAGVEG
jgi:hypothetical protein